ncbi:MAG: CBS domain-containing protein [Kiritimatiellales bacterium]|nr:CBS domain-containing protein [Kiritimatiellota bacterium]MBL7012588.1 CBS domain-containing protein [Kiritimatiellales bacterium]
MKSNLENTTVKDVSRLMNTTCLQAPISTSLETLAEMLCTSERYKVYLTNDCGQMSGVIQAKQIAMEVLKLSKGKEDADEMLPAISYVLNYRQAKDLASEVVSVTVDCSLKTVLNLMDCNSIREVAVVDAEGGLIGTLEAKHILTQYLHAKKEVSL